MATDGITTGASGLVAGIAMDGMATGTTGMEVAGTTAVALGRVGTSSLMWTSGKKHALPHSWFYQLAN